MGGWKDWQIGEVVTESDFQGFVQDQVVQVYADSAARGSALGTAVTDGMVSYLTGTNELSVYDGTNWGAISQAISPNYIINGAFDIWQRGTSFANVQFTQYTADRWYGWRGSGARFTVTRQVPSLEGFRFSARIGRPSGNTELNGVNFLQSFETANSVALANQTVTYSFWARAGANFSSASSALQATVSVGTGTDENWILGYTGNNNAINQNVTLTTSWQRFTLTGTLPANTNEITTRFVYTPIGTAGADDWFEITGVQLEAGSVATPFRRNANSLEGELAACQRYYFRQTANASNPYAIFGSGHANSSTAVSIAMPLKVTMRTAPTISTGGAFQVLSGGNFSSTTPSAASSQIGVDTVGIAGTVSGFTSGQATFLRANNDATAYIDFSAEL